MRFYYSMTAPLPEQIQVVLSAYDIHPVRVQSVNSGLINETYRVSADNGSIYVLQAVNGMFPPEINLDIDVVTRHLETSGLLTPRLQPNREGMIFHRENSQIWRLFNYIDGNIHQRLERPDLAEAAGVMLGRMHVGLDQLDYELQASRPGVHDTARHTQHLKSTLENKKDHARYATIRPLGEDILRRLEQLPELPAVSRRMVHGDPKISNFIFTTDNRSVKCLVDFDTFNKMPIYLELGDALRSWCNPPGEDSPAGFFSMEHCRAALAGYARYTGALLTQQEWLGIPPATLTICLELAARFCADALNEDFFHWEANEFRSHSEHSETRARGQLGVANSVLHQYDEIRDAVDETISPNGAML